MAQYSKFILKNKWLKLNVAYQTIVVLTR